MEAKMVGEYVGSFDAFDYVTSTNRARTAR